MSSSKNPIEAILHERLARENFRRKASSWYSAGKEVVLVLNLQRSQYGRSYYINLAVWLNALGEARAPREHECHIRTRLDSVVPPEIEENVVSLLDLENNLPFVERKLAIEHLIDQFALPFLESLSDLEGIRKQLEARNLERCLLLLDIKSVLGLGSEI